MGSHTVEKIGGTSMLRFDVMLDNVIIGNRSGDDLYHRIFVVSAYGGITDLLLENKKSGAPGVYKRFSADDPNWDQALSEVGDKMRSINESLTGLGLDLEAANQFVDDRIDGVRKCLLNLRQVCSYGHFQMDEYLPMIREMISSVGEAHSAFNSVNILVNRGIDAVLIDLSGWMDESNPKFEDKIRSAFSSVDFARQLPITTGYTKCSEGIMRTFDRGYSEITFSTIATITGASEGIIHKEFHLSTGDPNIVGEENVKIIGHTNYDVADQLADLGMEAIHPKASKAMERSGIPIRVKNAFEPDHPGTLISSNDFKSDEPRVEMITGRKCVSGVEVWDADMVSESGYDYMLLSYLKKYDISYIAKNTNANTITHYIPKNARGYAQCVAELRENLPAAEIRELDVAIVSAIGSNMKVPGFLAKAANALADAGINILALDQCMRQVNMQFIVDEKDFEAAICALHRGLVEN